MHSYPGKMGNAVPASPLHYTLVLHSPLYPKSIRVYSDIDVNDIERGQQVWETGRRKFSASTFVKANLLMLRPQA